MSPPPADRDPERWARIDELLAAALELPVAERDAFLAAACGEDPALREQVDSLLAHDRDDGFLDTSACAEVAELLADPHAPSLVGERIGPFEVLASIGSGGMGEVYLARDARLERRVALKRIPARLASDSERVRRFRREALATSALNHPNILTVHEILEHQGGDLLVTELVEGVTLRERLRGGALPPAAALDIALQIARGLAAAHAVGIVHRDLKPENVMIRGDGLVKVVDFGVAKSPPSGVGADGETSPGEVIGTAGYQSPEQARGLPVDARTDIWSLGVVLYEMLSGRSPFPGASAADRLAAILGREPTPLSAYGLAAAFDPVVSRALAKEVADRYGDLAELADDLERLRRESAGGAPPAARWWRPRRSRLGVAAAAILSLSLAGWLAVRYAKGGSSSGPEQPPRLAVLPFEDLGEEEKSDFAAGMTEEIIGGLASIHGLEVVSRTTVTQIRRTGKSLREIGRELGVDYVLEGSVRRDRSQPTKERVRISPQLIRVADDTHVWAGVYDRDLDDAFAVQSEITQQVVRTLGVVLTESEHRRVDVPPTRNPEAYNLYLRGLRALAYEDGNPIAGADLMHRAAELDPGFALAHAREASALAFIYFLGGPATDLEQARSALARAQAAAPNDPRVRLAAGLVRYQGERDYARALQELEAAGRAMPANGDVQQAKGAVLRRLGRYEEALALFEQARQLGTESVGNVADLEANKVTTCWSLRRYSEVDHSLGLRLEATPDLAGPWQDRAVLQLDWHGDTAAARSAMALAPPAVENELTGTRVLIELWDRHFATAAALAQPLLAAPSDGLLWWHAAYAYLRLGRTRETAAIVGRVMAPLSEQLAKRPDDSFAHRQLALAHALVGAREPALRHGREAIAILANDAFWGPKAVEELAIVWALLGDDEQALALLPGLLAKSYERPLSLHRLRGEPWWDALRGDPRFERLLESGGTESRPPR